MKTKIPKFSMLLIVSGIIYFIITIIHFGFVFYDLSQLISNLVIGGGFFALSYIYWFFRNTDYNFEDISKDIKSINSTISNIENRLIKLNDKEV